MQQRRIKSMGRKLNLIIMVFIFMLLIPLPLFARDGYGGKRGGFGQGGFQGGFRGQGSGGKGTFGGRGFGARSGFGNIGNRGFDNKRFGHGDSGHFDRKHFGHKDFRHFDRKDFHHKHHHHHDNFSSSFFLGLGFGAVFPFVTYPYYAYPYYYSYDPYPSSAQSYGDLEIQASPEDVEVYVDGRFIGFAGDFEGRAVVLVPSGNHEVEFRYNGSSSSSSVYVTPDSKSAVSGEFKPLSESPREEAAPQY
jgi:hypothetical protein